MSKILVLTTAVLLAGAPAIIEAFKGNPEGAAADILSLEEERKAAIAVAEASLSESAAEHAASFKNGDTLYGFHFKTMMYKGARITMEDVLASEALQEELVSSGSGMVYPLS